jgi:hypothetical protein
MLCVVVVRREGLAVAKQIVEAHGATITLGGAWRRC